MSRRVEFADALAALARAGVPFVVVGVGGINFYAADPSDAVVTEDLDLLLKRDVASLRHALEVLAGLDFAFEAGGEPLVDIDDVGALTQAVRAGACITARHESGTTLDLMLAGAGLSWPEIASDAASFRIGSTEIRVGRLERLLRAKQLAGRPKDLEFLRMFAARFSDPDADA